MEKIEIRKVLDYFLIENPNDQELDIVLRLLLQDIKFDSLGSRVTAVATEYNKSTRRGLAFARLRQVEYDGRDKPGYFSQYLSIINKNGHDMDEAYTELKETYPL